MSFWEVSILAIVEGITEFLPISSTGHLILTANILQIQQSDFVKTFEIVIQSGVIAAVLVLYGKTIFSRFDLLKKIAIAFIPTGVSGLVFYSFIKDFLIGNMEITLFALLFGGIAIIAVEFLFAKQKSFSIFKNSKQRKDINDLTYKDAFLVGVFQSVAMIPGVSRSAATIIGGLLSGLERKAAVELSFMLAIPTMIAATGYDLLQNIQIFDNQQIIQLGLGFIISFVTAIAVIRWFLRFIQKYSLIPFGIYRIGLSFIFLLLIL